MTGITPLALLYHMMKWLFITEIYTVSIKIKFSQFLIKLILLHQFTKRWKSYYEIYNRGSID
ncbi:hypothetical protein OSCI_2610008 [Kamptonema sp. PCC 6506]|nr:hypothetical protein OSCI_2610008 [Kamptonema sp. PCC 6506]